ncbi:unnamed protein product [Dicrocoelium dendriticum]|nr:unnamed protein product [Dicrocoelium dendriticum]
MMNNADGTYLSPAELVRAISAVTNREVSMDILSKPELMHETMWVLITYFFDMPHREFSRVKLLDLMNKVVTDLRLAAPFDIIDLDCGDRRKWMFMFSKVIEFIQLKQTSHGTQFYQQALASKAKYAEGQEALSAMQSKLSLNKPELLAKQEKLQYLTQLRGEISSARDEMQTVISNLENQIAALDDSELKVTEKISALKLENKQVVDDLLAANAEILQDVENLPDSIGHLKDCLEEIEADICSLFEKLTSILEQTTELQHLESKLVQLKECVSEVYVALNQYSSLKQKEKHNQLELDQTLAAYENKRAEADSCAHTASDLQSGITRRKLLLVNKKKPAAARQANQSRRDHCLSEMLRSTPSLDLKHKSEAIDRKKLR